jgi:hypothetical protein
VPAFGEISGGLFFVRSFPRKRDPGQGARRVDALFYCCSVSSSLPERLLLEFQNRRQEVADQPAGTGLDLHGNGHAMGEIDRAVFDVHLRAVEDASSA